jgi:hypothetical protein
MKYIIVHVMLLISLLSVAQQKTAIKANVPLLEDKPKAKVPLLTDMDDLLEIKSNEPDPNDLLDIKVPVVKPAVPNAGQQVGKEIGLNGSFTFNKKIGFSVASPEGNMVSYFYLNTKNGYAMMDGDGLTEMAGSNEAGEMTQIKTANNDFLQYIKSSEGNFVMKMGSGQEMVMHDIATGNLSRLFFKTFKKTGNKMGREGGNKFPRVEYEGMFEGKKMSIWLSDPKDVLIDTRFTYSLDGYWGLGFIASPSGKTYMVTGIQGSGAGIFMTYMENENKSFSGVGYKPVGEVMTAGIMKGKAENDIALQEMYAAANAEKDPQLRSIMMQQIEQYKKLQKKTVSDAEKFAKSSDMQDLPFIKDLITEKGTEDYYNMMLLMLDQRITENEIALKEAQKNKDEKAVKLNTCLVGCAKAERARWENLKTEHIRILKQYKNDDDKRDEKINELMLTAGQSKACNCE